MEKTDEKLRINPTIYGTTNFDKIDFLFFVEFQRENIEEKLKIKKFFKL